MRRILVLLLPAALYAQNATIALKDMVKSTRSFMFLSIVIQAILALLFIAGALLTYFEKLRGVQKKRLLHIAAAIIMAFLGLLFLMGTVFGFFVYVTTPVIVENLLQ
jgi:hypothetical protein